MRFIDLLRVYIAYLSLLLYIHLYMHEMGQYYTYMIYISIERRQIKLLIELMVRFTLLLCLAML